jgi:hypothetical protein
MDGRVRANLLGGTENDRKKILRALAHLFNSDTIEGFVEILAVYTTRGTWTIEVAHLHGLRLGVRTAQMPRGVPTEMRIQLMAELSGLGLAIEGASMDN